MAGPSRQATLRRGPPSGLKEEVRVGGHFMMGKPREARRGDGKALAGSGDKSKICWG